MYVLQCACHRLGVVVRGQFLSSYREMWLSVLLEEPKTEAEGTLLPDPRPLTHPVKVIWALFGMAPVSFRASIPGLLNFIRLLFNELEKKNFTSQSY